MAHRIQFVFRKSVRQLSKNINPFRKPGSQIDDRPVAPPDKPIDAEARHDMVHIGPNGVHRGVTGRERQSAEGTGRLDTGEGSERGECAVHILPLQLRIALFCRSYILQIAFLHLRTNPINLFAAL